MAKAVPTRALAYLSRASVVLAHRGPRAGRLVQWLVGGSDCTGGSAADLAARAPLRGAHRLGARQRLLPSEARLVDAQARGGSPRPHPERALERLPVRSALSDDAAQCGQRGNRRRRPSRGAAVSRPSRSRAACTHVIPVSRDEGTRSGLFPPAPIALALTSRGEVVPFDEAAAHAAGAVLGKAMSAIEYSLLPRATPSLSPQLSPTMRRKSACAPT